MFARPDGEEQPGGSDGSSQPEGPYGLGQQLPGEPRDRNIRPRHKDDGTEKDDSAHDSGQYGFETLGRLGAGSLDLPIEKKANPEHGEERFVEPEHRWPH